MSFLFICVSSNVIMYRNIIRGCPRKNILYFYIGYSIGGLSKQWSEPTQPGPTSVEISRLFTEFV